MIDNREIIKNNNLKNGKIYKKIINNTCTNIENELRDIFGENTNKFKEKLEENNCIIAGSFVVNCMTGDSEWKYGDIDIFVSTILFYIIINW